MERRTKIHIIAYSALSAIIIALIIWAWSQMINRQNTLNSLNNQYNRAFMELVTYVDDIQTSLDKGLLASTPAQMASISGELFRQSTAAKACLGQLPISDISMDNTSKFLSQVGDYTYVLSQNMINDEKISEEEYQTLASLSDFAKGLNTSLSDIQSDLFEGNISFVQDSSKGTVRAADDFGTGMETIEKEFQEYPSLIYDGPFSEHIQSSRPLMLENTTEFSQDECKRRAAEFLNIDINSLTFESEMQNTNMNAFTFTSNDKTRQRSISLTKQGGYVIYYLDNRIVTEEKLSFADAAAKASEFLTAHGYSSMKQSYYDKSNCVATINFAYQQGNITCYSDLIKVRVALDTGEIVGFEAKGYLMSHAARNINPPKISKSDAISKINSHLTVEGATLAIIPKDSLKEVLCWEIHGKANDKNFIIYINADNGREEKILLLLESPDGILTI